MQRYNQNEDIKTKDVLTNNKQSQASRGSSSEGRCSPRVPRLDIAILIGKQLIARVLDVVVSGEIQAKGWNFSPPRDTHSTEQTANAVIGNYLVECVKRPSIHGIGRSHTVLYLEAAFDVFHGTNDKGLREPRKAAATEGLGKGIMR